MSFKPCRWTTSTRRAPVDTSGLWSGGEPGDRRPSFGQCDQARLAPPEPREHQPPPGPWWVARYRRLAPSVCSGVGNTLTSRTRAVGSSPLPAAPSSWRSPAQSPACHRAGTPSRWLRRTGESGLGARRRQGRVRDRLGRDGLPHADPERAASGGQPELPGALDVRPPARAGRRRKQLDGLAPDLVGSATSNVASVEDLHATRRRGSYDHT